jgi:hypothetical protein
VIVRVEPGLHGLELACSKPVTGRPCQRDGPDHGAAGRRSRGDELAKFPLDDALVQGHGSQARGTLIGQL